MLEYLDIIKELNKKMHKAAAELNFEEAAEIRDRITEIRRIMDDNG